MPNYSAGPVAIDASELARRSFQLFEVRQNLKLASLLDPAARARVNAKEEVVTYFDRGVTRQWGHYFQEKIDDSYVGLAYNSTQDTVGKGFSFILWGDRIRLRNPFKPAGPEQTLVSPEFGPVVERVLREYDVDIENL